ncbi:succinate dehydrogenase, hydrophobic membrane anchor protein [Sphingomonas quercus]|uniref:Succinate dehydrogenase hydrophobic membrane anchor subunit n=1 Tax=Sphingomonas quercus TaxID=2842451 RepID=A0ABS6BN06_9SPHN|nr:succinate dehydrogenase, hydrophobic membrane anchor protein [Sphingomonas quercus]MBU3079181.1 succinate dehydrogenase, hydrophobic membrane anchor protein [Sphingomonas quercus]
MGTGTGIGRVRGLGSARHGVSHWLLQRLTACGNLLLVIWFLVSLLRLPALDYATVTAWIASPLVAVPLILLTISVFWHLRIGLQVFIEDYVHEDGGKIALLVLLTFYAIGGAALAIFAIVRIALSGAAA